MNLELREISQTRRLKTHDSTPVRNLKQSDSETESSERLPSRRGAGRCCSEGGGFVSTLETRGPVPQLPPR